MLSNVQRIEAFHDLEASYSKLLAHIKIETSTKQGNVTQSLIKSDEVSDKASGVFQDLLTNYPSALIYSLIRKMPRADVQLPEVLSYYQLLGISDISQLSIERIRKQSDITISLSVPIGKDMNQEVVYLDLHQKGDGPNGVIIGLPGTGKSEFISTLCLSMCLFYSPDEIRLHIIDNFLPQKFGGLPHLGECAHFEKSEIENVIQTIDAELQRRKRIFRDNSVSNVYQYLKKRKKADEPKEPVPHLILIIDDLNWLSQCNAAALDKLDEWENRINASCLGLHIIFTNQVHHSIDNRMIRKFGDFKISSWISKNENSEKLKNYPGRIYLQSHARTKTSIIQLAYCGEVFTDEYIDSFEGFFLLKEKMLRLSI